MGFTGGTLAIAMARRVPIVLAAVVFAIAASFALAIVLDGGDGQASPVVPETATPTATPFHAGTPPGLPALPKELTPVATPEPTSTPGPTATPTPFAAPEDAPTNGLTLWAGGDSMSVWLTRALENIAPDYGMTPVFRCEFGALDDMGQSCLGATGLVSTSNHDWPAALEQVAATSDPDVFVFMVGGNDAQYFRGNEFGTEGWDEAYGDHVGDVMDSIRADDRVVVWVGQPNARYEGAPAFDEKMRHLNAIYAEEASRRPGVEFVDTYELFGGEDFASHSDLRQADGLHFNYEGGEYLAHYVIHTIVEMVEGRSR